MDLFKKNGYDYDVVVIGGGAAGLTAALSAVEAGARTALVEKNRIGGDCTWYGCIPSKSLLKSAQVADSLKRLHEFGIRTTSAVSFESSGVLPHVRDVIHKISSHEQPDDLEKRGIKVFFGAPRFINRHHISLNGMTVSAKRYILATGSRPVVPPIFGLDKIDYLTNENVFDLEQVPESLTVLGGGPIGMELSQAFARLGTKVAIVEMAGHLLPREDPEIANILAERFREEKIGIYSGHQAVQFERGERLIRIALQTKDKQGISLESQHVLIAVGRRANTEGLDLEAAGIEHSSKGVAVNRHLQTTAGNIYACGDAVGPYQFSHMAEYQAVTAIVNALLPLKRRVNYDHVPWCTFTDPELARVGLTEEEARRHYRDVRVFRSYFAENDRAVTDGEETGRVKIVCDRANRILGAHLVGAHAGELIHEIILAKHAGLKVTRLSSVIHIYPALSQALKRAADQYYIEMARRVWFKRMIKFFIKWTP